MTVRRRESQPRLSPIAAGLILCGLGLLPPALIANGGSRRVVEVEIHTLSFAQTELEISVGTTVRWINRDPVPHTSTSVDELWDSSLIEPGESYEFTFEEEGEFGYYCLPHPFMKAKVLVKR